MDNGYFNKAKGGDPPPASTVLIPAGAPFSTQFVKDGFDVATGLASSVLHRISNQRNQDQAQSSTSSIPDMESRDREEWDSYTSEGGYEKDDNEDMLDYDDDSDDNWNGNDVEMDTALVTGMASLMDATPSMTGIAQTDQPPAP